MTNLDFELEYSWLKIWEENYASSDYALSESIFVNDFLSDRLKNITPDKSVYEYDQSAQYRTRNACTLYMWIKMVSDLWDYQFSIKEILEICDLAEKEYWWSEKDGNWLYKSIDCVRNYWNKKYPEKEIVSFTFSLNSKEFEILKNSWKTLWVWYSTSVWYFNDSQDNWNIDHNSFASERKTGWHAVCFNNWKIIDNYYWKKKYNKYTNEKIVDLSKEWTFFRNWYVFFKKEEILSKINLKNAKIAYKLWLWNWQNAKNSMSREEVRAVFVNWIKKIFAKELTIEKIEEIEKEL